MVSIALVIVVLFFVLNRLVPEADPRLEERFDTLRLPGSLKFVAEGTEGEGAPFFGERATAVRVYGSEDEVEDVCETISRPLTEWGVLVEQDRLLQGVTPGCGFLGQVAASEVGYDVEVVALETYRQRESASGFYWEGAATSTFTTIVEIEVYS